MSVHTSSYLIPNLWSFKLMHGLVCRVISKWVHAMSWDDFFLKSSTPYNYTNADIWIVIWWQKDSKYYQYYHYFWNSCPLGYFRYSIHSDVSGIQISVSMSQWFCSCLSSLHSHLVSIFSHFEKEAPAESRRWIKFVQWSSKAGTTRGWVGI